MIHNYYARAKRLYRNRKRFKDSGSILAKASRFVACEMIEGDYLEFGVYQGASFISAYHWLARNFSKRIALNVGGEGNSEDRRAREEIWGNMRFFAFDSFAGLPPLEQEDQESPDFKAGQYACSESDFIQNITNDFVPRARVHTVKGFFQETCVKENYERLSLKKAAIVWLDADLYSSTRDVLQFITPLLQDGTILIFDDWFSFKGHPSKGVQLAFNNWSAELKDKFRFGEYQRDSWKRMSFIASEINTPVDGEHK